MSRPHKVHELLSRSELDQLEAFAREPGRTIDECHEWLQAQGFTMSRGAVHNWKRDFDAQVLQERFSRSGELARALKSAVADKGFEDVADAAVMQLTQVVFEQASKLEADGEIDPLDVQRMTKSLANLVGGKVVLTKIFAAKFEREMREMRSKQQAAPGTISEDDIAKVRKAVFGV